MLPSAGFVRIILLRFGIKLKKAYSNCRDNFLAQRPLPDMRWLFGDDFLCFSRTAPRRISTRHRRVPGTREKRETSRRLSACVHVRQYPGDISSTNSDNFEPICHDN